MTPDRDHVLFAIHYERRLIGASRLALFYAPELVPVLIVSNNRRTRSWVACPTDRSSTSLAGARCTASGQRRSASRRTRVTPRVQVYGGSGAGTVWFTRAVPDPWARAFNFMFDLGAGVLWQVVGDAWRAAYMFHHLLNANTAPRNPGVAGAIWIVGIQHALARGQIAIRL